jgi:predicted permease
MFSELLAWLRNTLGRSPADESLDRELRSCVEIIAANKVRDGLDASEARRQALIEIGGIELVKERVRDSRRGAGVESVVLDVRHAARVLRREPLGTAAVVLTLSIGIGAVATAFTLLNGFVFRTPVSRDPGAYVRVVRQTGGGHGTASVPEYLAWRERARSVRELAAWSTLQLRAPLGTTDPADVPGLLVTCNFFAVLGVDAPSAGRLLDEQDCRSAAPVAVLSEGLWRRRLGSDPAIVGSVFRYGPVAITVVGVAATPGIQREAHDPDPDFAAGIWFPYTAQPALSNTLTLFQGRDFWSAQHADKRWLEVAGLLLAGASRESATAEFRALDARSSHTPADPDAVVLTDGSRWASTPDKMLAAMAMALALPVLVMVVACLNAAALLLSRTVARHKEMAIRLALGTNHGRLVRMLIVESLLLSVLAVIGSLFFAYTLPPMIVSFLEAELVFGAPESVVPDWRVLVCLGATGALAGLLAGLTPALESRNPRLMESLQRNQAYGTSGGVSRRRRVFVAIQITASTVVLVTAVTFARTASRMTHPGFNTEGLLIAEIRDQRDSDVSLETLAAGVGGTSGVESVAYAETLPLLFEGAIRVRVPHESTIAAPVAASVSPGYLELFGIRVLTGRGLVPADATPGAGPTPVVISRRLAERFFASENAVGEYIETTESPSRRLVVVGVVANRPTGRAMTSAALNDGSVIYEPKSATASSGFLILKTRASGSAAPDAIRRRLSDFTGSPTPVRTFESILAEQLMPVRRLQTLLAAMGIISLILAVIGVAGAMTSDARYRQKEFAIRLALGATPSAVRWHVVGSGLHVVPAGVMLGVIASWAVLKIAESERILPLGSIANDAGPYLTVAFGLIMVALTTLLLLASRAGRRDLLAVLRAE